MPNKKRWWRKRLPWEDESSSFHIPGTIRTLWVVLGGAAVGGIKYFEVGKSYEDVPDGVALLFAAPLVIGATLRALWPGERRLRSLGPTKPGREGPQGITTILRSIHDLIVTEPLDVTAKLRVTLFVPDVPSGLLRQIARFSAETSTVSKTTVRMGTGDVGRAFTWSKTAHIHNVAESGGFEECMRALGLEPWEIDAHGDKSRKSFYAIPLIASESRKRYGVLSLDACEPDFFTRHATDIANAKRLLQGLLQQLVSAEFPGVPLPTGTEGKKTDGAPRDEDSNPFIRTRSTESLEEIGKVESESSQKRASQPS